MVACLFSMLAPFLQLIHGVQGTAAPCLLAAGRDEAAQDSVLLYATEALLRTHGRFYQKLLTSSSGSEAYRTTSVCNVMAEELSTVLQGCTLLLASCTSSLKVRPSSWAGDKPFIKLFHTILSDGFSVCAGEASGPPA